MLCCAGCAVFHIRKVLLRTSRSRGSPATFLIWVRTSRSRGSRCGRRASCARPPPGSGGGGGGDADLDDISVAPVQSDCRLKPSRNCSLEHRLLSTFCSFSWFSRNHAIYLYKVNCVLVLFEHEPIFTVCVEIGSANPTKTYTFIDTSGVPFTFPQKRHHENLHKRICFLETWAEPDIRPRQKYQSFTTNM